MSGGRPFVPAAADGRESYGAALAAALAAFAPGLTREFEVIG